MIGRIHKTNAYSVRICQCDLIAYLPCVDKCETMWCSERATLFWSSIWCSSKQDEIQKLKFTLLSAIQTVFSFIESGKNFLDSSDIAANTGLKTKQQLKCSTKDFDNISNKNWLTTWSCFARSNSCTMLRCVWNIEFAETPESKAIYCICLCPCKKWHSSFFFFKCLFQGRVESAEAAFTRARDAAWNGP